VVEELLELGITEELIVLIVSVLPVAELRGALPIAINLFHMPWYWALPLAVIGSLLPVPFLLLFLGALTKAVSRTESGKKLVNWVSQRTRKRGLLSSG